MTQTVKRLNEHIKFQESEQKDEADKPQTHEIEAKTLTRANRDDTGRHCSLLEDKDKLANR